MVHPDSYRVSRAPYYSGTTLRSFWLFAYVAVTLYGLSSHKIRLSRIFLTPHSRSSCCSYRPTTPVTQRLQPWHVTGLGFFHFARHYSGNLGWFLLFELLRCFTSLASPVQAIYSPEHRLAPPVVVAPFGYPRIYARWQLPAASRSLPRPSSAPDAKASTICSFQLNSTLHSLQLFS